ncbi:MAG: toxin-antitoxin system YwqK family antitoxin [Sandaracinaceae bacterium]
MGLHPIGRARGAALSLVMLVTLMASTASAQRPSSTRDALRLAIEQLASPTQTTRDDAAARARALVEAEPRLRGTEAQWRRRLAWVRPGTTEAELRRRAHATPEGAMSGGGGTTASYRLDDFWVAVVVLDATDHVREIAEIVARARDVWVQPPSGFTGRWRTYTAGGSLSHDIEYANGTYVRFAQYHDNGQLAYEQRYVRGQIDGEERGFYPDGSRMYVIHHAMGRDVGHWVHWFANGQVQLDQTYVAGELDGVVTHYREDGSRQVVFLYERGRELGQAAWDEHGTLQYAHGAADAWVRSERPATH